MCTPSMKLHEALGFKKEGIRRDSLYFNRKYHNEIIMSILENEFKQLYANHDEDLKSLL
ncbi:GNAT family N-acetyltransferase [Clostridium sp. UBA6640]|uniref:GNAT family N-acetyltransferase n=1 Tax=Clostridium sp. UBA6640 TaxID=1946370 RepID=UPI0025BDE146|nr:GNAT family protein [Clostridium sp. UBA6640]